MSLLCDFRCNGPLCTVVCGTASAETPHGWLALDNGHYVTHFCSLACLAKYAAEHRDLVPCSKEPA